jgi:hypothetical protein
MTEFSKKIMESVGTLRKIYEKGRNVVKINYPAIEISKYEKNKEIVIVLLYDSIDGTFELQEPVYRYYSKISYYDFKRPENRWTRNKKFLFNTIRNLKRGGFWEKISNKDFLVVNKLNTEADYKNRLEMLKEVKNRVPGIPGVKESSK